MIEYILTTGLALSAGLYCYLTVKSLHKKIGDSDYLKEIEDDETA